MNGNGEIRMTLQKPAKNKSTVQTTAAQNSMGTQRMSRLILVTGLPLMLSLLINSLYNFVDSVFVSYVSEDALTALSLASPVQMIVSSLGLGNAVGLNAAISKALGEKRPDKVKKIANASIFLAICFWLLNVVLCVLFVRPYFLWQSGGNETIAAYGQSYLSVCMLFSLGQMGQWVFDRFVIASGKSHLFLYTLSAASITNLILDPILIFGLFGLPRMEALGAALATVIGQTVGLIAGILINLKWNKEIPFSFTLRPDKESIVSILRVGIPSTLVQIFTSFVSVAMNSILIAFSTTAVAVYGICAKIHNLTFVCVSGINLGVIPIVAYNFGAKNRQRVDSAVRWAILYSVGIFLVMLLAMELAPGLVLNLFDASAYMLEIGTPALRLLAFAWLISIPGAVLSSALQGLSMGTQSLILNTTRQTVLPLVFALIFSLFGRLTWIWIALILVELLCLPLALFIWKRARGTLD